MDTQLLQSGYATQAAPFMVPTVVILAIIYVWTYATSSPVINLPQIKNNKGDYMRNGPQLLRDGYKKYSAWVMTTFKGQTVVLSRKHMVDLLKRPEEVYLEFELPVQFDFQSKLTGFSTNNHKVIHVIRASLTTAIPRIVGRLAEDIEKIITEYFPQSTEWVEVKPVGVITDVVAIAAGTILVGPDLCRKDEWINGAKRYVGAAIKAGFALRQWPWFLRPLVARTMPEMQGLGQVRQAMNVVLQPVIKERERGAKEPNWEQTKPDDYLQWYMDSPMESHVPLAEVVLGLGMASLNSTTTVTSEAIYDLAAFPQYQEPIRAEVKAALAKNNGLLTKDALYQCHLLDSFLKESQRLHPELYAFGKRVLLKDFTLSDGTLIPKGTYVCCPSEAVAHDPAIYENPDEFDGYRHYRLRQQGGFTGEKHQWISSHQNALHFGYGKHSCPGRFFATVEIKLIFAFIMLNYDLSLPTGEQRPPSHIQGEHSGPDPEGRILVRRRTKA